MALKLTLDSKPVWVKGSSPHFDDSELAIFSQEQRDEIEFLIAPLTGKLVDEVRGETTETKTETVFRSGKRNTERKEQTDWKAYNETMVHRLLQDWKGIEDDDGNLMPCNNENREKFADIYGGIVSGVVSAARWVTIESQRDQEDAEKNLKGSPAGKPKGKKQ